MSDPARTFSGDFKRFFVRGLVVLLPTILTLWLVVYAYRFVDRSIAEPINGGIRSGLYSLAPYWRPLRDWFDPDAEDLESFLAAAGPKPPPREQALLVLRRGNIEQWWAARWYMDIIGLVVAIVAVYVAGRLLGGYIGRRVYRHVERLIVTVPVFKQVYPYVKQIVDFLFGDDRAIKFSRVVLCEYPRKGIWSLGFQTGPAMRTFEDNAGLAVNIFIPSSPTPFTGYTIVVPRSDVIEVPISVEEAIRFVVSGGVLVPDRQRSEHLLAGSAEAMLAGALASAAANDKHRAGAADEDGDGAAGAAIAAPAAGAATVPASRNRE